MMCDLTEHICYCGNYYRCTDPNWLCPTINEDEEQYMCPDCLIKAEEDILALKETWDDQ